MVSLTASGGYVNIIKLLLNHGAEINSRTGSELGISPLMLAASKGTTLDFTVNGHDAEEALQQIETLINNRFDEGE